MARSLPLPAAVVASAAIFAVVHPPISAAPVFVLGIACAIGFHRTGSLIPPIMTHMVYNLVMVILNAARS